MSSYHMLSCFARNNISYYHTNKTPSKKKLSAMDKVYLYFLTLNSLVLLRGIISKFVLYNFIYYYSLIYHTLRGGGTHQTTELFYHYAIS